MATYNFKREAKLYVVIGSARYRLDIYPDLSFSQTFNETSVPVKTLHSQFDMFEQAVVNSANAANFNFTVPVSRAVDFDAILTLLRDYNLTSTEATLNTSDFYLEMASETYKLEMAVIESATFQIVRNQIIVLNCAGTARTLSKFTGTIPGTLADKAIVQSYTAPLAMDIVINNVTKSNIVSVSIELKNNVQWLEANTLQKSLGINDASGTMYPEAFVVQNRTLSGTLQQYVTDETNSTANSWVNGQPLRIRVGNSGSDWLLDFNIPSVVYTNRIGLEELLTQSYDFRMISSPANMSTIITRS